uniref:Usher syndrome type IIa protein homolog n=1 Tax=Denticeps clupeoides TaxID=299321 RepID=A0AAY4ADY9_9TELE
MHWLFRQKGLPLLLCVLGFYISCCPVAPQGHFPRLQNVGACKPVSAFPPESTCGVPERNAYCQPAATPDDLRTCAQQFCVQECPYRSSSPPHADLLSSSLGTCVTMDSRDRRPGAEPEAGSLIFRNQPDCFASSPVPNLGSGGSFTLTAWLKPENGTGTVIEKSVEGQIAFLITISEEAVELRYSVRSGQSFSLSMRTMGRISKAEWTHVALQVGGTIHVSLFLNGLEEDSTAFDTHSLVGPIVDIRSDSAMWIGQSSNGSNQFIGRMQDFRFYPVTLTNRSIVEVFSGHLPHLHAQSECRCPPSHPRVHPLVERYCIPNSAEDTTNNRVLRLNLDAHPLHYINDNDIGTSWISSVFLSPEILHDGVTVTFDLENGDYEVFYVILQFLSPQPEAVRIQRKTRGSPEWRDWQYLAKNCSVFGLEDNGALERPDSVNCLQFPSEVPYSRGNVTFSMLTPEPNLRPGYNDFYNSPALQEFVRASQVRIHLRGQYHTQQARVPYRHRYYGVDEITISGRCHCHGHADSCDTRLSPYHCVCTPESHTQGKNCERCAALFNDKPFRSGNQLQAFNCRPCQCNGHASSCHYDIAVDPYPEEHFRGGGGVCDNCQHNTAGRNCERCQSLFFREQDEALWTHDVCRPCACYAAGTVNGSLECDEIGGQCKCKRHVSGRQCNQCQHGFYKLQHSHPDGCRACNCNTAGTERADITCHQDSGQCQCKANVIGLTCDRCNYGFKLLNHINPEGCVPCGCHGNGSLHQFCNPFLGQCECKDGVQGLLCDTCAPNFYGLTTSGKCHSCECSLAGTILGSTCDPVTGQCSCKRHVEGQCCDTCRPGYHSLDQTNSLGCLPCQCNLEGTVNATNVCNPNTGQCPCTEWVEGLQCTHCTQHTFNRTSTDGTYECVPCDCHPEGTVPRSMCESATGQCVCLPSWHGRDCGTCRPGKGYSANAARRCDVCDCHPVGAEGQACQPDTGQCVCRHPSVTGRKCDQCQELHFGFNPGIGRCEACGCDPVGGLDGSCHPQSGQCLCKLFVTGEKCDTCVHGASHMDPDNHLGCTKAPSQQPPPVGYVVSSSAISLSWGPPDSPNSNTLWYHLLRDTEEIHTIRSLYPFDNTLSPYEEYSYQLVTSNIHGNTSSTVVNYRTLSTVPFQEELKLFQQGRIRPNTISFNWTIPQNTSGPLEHFVLNSVNELTGEKQVHYTGLQTEATARGLSPFTRYSFFLQACTSGGCAQSDRLTLSTAQIPPLHQAPPTITTLGPNQLEVAWDPPIQTNGIIIRYELFMRGPIYPLENDTGPPAEDRVFLSSGWLNRQQTISSANENALTPPQSNVTVSNLEPYSMYQFRVLTVNMAGSTLSKWASGRTAEGVPEYLPPPQVSPVSSSSLRVTWDTPQDRDIRGRVTEYKVSVHQQQTSNPFAPPISTQVNSLTILSISPPLLVMVAPAGLSAPKLMPLNMTAMEVSWDPPRELNGPPPLYHLERTDVSFSDPFDPVIRGTRFLGNGYFRFPSSTLPVNSDFTGLQLSFRTRAKDGLILCALSPGSQEEYVALQMHNGRPFFLFDPQASAVALSPEDDGGRWYNDNQWHHVIATRKQAVGTIIVDNQYRGSASATSGSTIIGENTGVFIGGLPRSDARLVQQGFSGCLRDVLVKRADRPFEEWEPLNWDAALEEVETYESWEGCPAHSEEGAHFLGHGFLQLKTETFSGGENFEISFEFKTDQLNTLLLFAYDTDGEDYIQAELQGGILTWTLHWGTQVTEVSLWVGLSYCDGGWNSLTLQKRGALASAELNEAFEEERSATRGILKVTSPLYLGGVPPDLTHRALTVLNLLHGFGGCIRNVKFTRGPVVNLAAVSSNAVRVNLDGCLSADTSVNCRGNDSILVYTGREQRAEDLALQPFTEYLYRVMASGEGGWAAGPWGRGRSREMVPQSVLTPSRVVCVNGYSAEVSWDEPAEVRGVIEKYIVKAYNRDDPSSSPISATFLHVDHLTGKGNLSGLTPFTRYSITLTACSRAGCSESTDSGRSVSTPEEAPEDVSPPDAVSYPNTLSLYWSHPQRPNGIITEYLLYRDNTLIYRGNDTEFSVTGLDVYTPHRLLLSGCTSAGCSNSTEVTLYTGQLPPAHMDQPVLTVLDSHSVYVWTAPMEVNGVLEFYTLYLSTPGEEPTVVYNSSQLFEDHTLRNLVPGTTYLFQIAACSGGGCTLSLPTQARTEESTPEDVPAPTVVPLSPDSFSITWTPPLKPNGVITSYSLWMNGVLVQNSSALDFVVSDLSAWSLHSFRVQACTAKGCALGPLVEARTLEMAPVGSVALEVLSESPNSVRARWQAPAKPNGNLTYTLLFAGVFYQPSGSGFGCKKSLLSDSKSIFGLWTSVDGLLPFTNYTVSVHACNSQGCVESPPTAVTLPPGAPDGVMPPRLAAATPSTLQVVWSAPARYNAPGPLRYRLQMRTAVDQPIQDHTAEGLQPYTLYQFRLLVAHSHGETASPWVPLLTAQDRPGSVDPPVISDIFPRSATISWRPPSQPHGIITQYNIYKNADLAATVPGNTSSFNYFYLQPYRNYTLQVEACTVAGCTLSAKSHTFRTPPAPPMGVQPPRLFSDTPTSVLLSWDPPLQANGELEGYTVERRVHDTQQISVVATLNPEQPLTYLDNSAALSPWTSYEYRVVASTLQGGSNSSRWHRVTTRPSRPAGLQPPQVMVLGPDSVQVTWAAPLIANGEIERYEIRMPDPRISFSNTSVLNYTVTNLVPHTNYSVTILACSTGGGYIGGCTESLATSVTTLPTIPQGLGPLSVVAVSESFLAVSWQPPSRPNGPNLRYELLRRKTRQPLASLPPEDLNLWYNVYAGAKLFHEDKGLSRFTEYQYKLMVYNDVGYATGETATAVTLAGVPLAPSSLSALTINHTAIHVSWTTPTLQDLQGEVVLFTLWVNTTECSQALVIGPEVNAATIGDLKPNTEYRISLQVFNGAHNATSKAVTCTTADGEPEGVFPPEVVTLNSTAVRVLWLEPLTPNGAIVEYRIYVDGGIRGTANNISGSMELSGLLPFTVYDVQVEVCTVYACVKSNTTQVTTVEDLPADITAPHIQVLGSRSIKLDWSSPGQPNGIMLGYDVRRRILKPCEELLTLQTERPEMLCLVLFCYIIKCFFFFAWQTCCGETVYSHRPSYQCCGEHFLPSQNASVSICCGGQLVQAFPDHRCCGGYYIMVPPGEVCCPNSKQMHVSVGLGDSCCGGKPFSSSAGQICCGGLLHDGFHSQCCGGRVVDRELVCCGDEDQGVAHTSTSGMSCCGELYVNLSATLCCGGDGEEPRVHQVDNLSAAVKCCRSEVIQQGEECCNGVGYNPSEFVCADQASPGVPMEVNHCSPSTLCPVSAAARAYCGSCEFNPTLAICTWAPGLPSPPNQNPPHAETASGLCPTSEDLIYSGTAHRYSFTDTGLEPFSTYEYRVSAWNSFGRSFSSFALVTTKEDTPQGVPTPHWRKVGSRDDIIYVEWAPPTHTNGKISHYVILRDGQERYRGSELSFTDVVDIRPFQEYVYQLRACTAAGCTDSHKVVAVTVQGVPENVPAPMVSVLGPRALQLSWTPPARPNGVIREYHINQSGAGLIFTDTQRAMRHTLTGLQPHTDYSFVLTACTSAGCGASQPSTGRTLQDAPVGVWASPRHVLVSPNEVELYWSEPSQPNGLLSQYRLLRDAALLFTGDRRNMSYTDTGLQPNSRYVYELEASTGGGSSRSDRYVIQTPVSSPEQIQPPYNVTVTSPRSVFVAWTAPGVFNASLPLEYNVLLNPGSKESLIRVAGRDQYLHLPGLHPFTHYLIRVQACQPDGCGVGKGVNVQTSEAAPEEMEAPIVKAVGPTVIEVRWTQPHKPNGFITAYFIHRRPVRSRQELLVFIWSQGPLEFIDASDVLQPFTEYEFRVKASNAQGSVTSPWASTLTLEAEPQGMTPPSAWPTSAYALLLNWTRPASPNGVISQYRVVYQKRQSDPTLNVSPIIAVTVPGEVMQAHVFGLEPHTTYNARVEAVNGAGSVSSPWAMVRTMEASPSGLANFSVEKKEHGRALMLQWPEPDTPNGVIRMYNIYSEDNLEFSGLSRQFLFRRLEPYTTYSLVLEACTQTGCTRTAPQPITTEEATPSSSPPPITPQIKDSSVQLTWVPPTLPNGRILYYQVMGVAVEEGRVMTEDDYLKRAKVFFTENNTQASSFSYNVTGLLPWTRYKFLVRVVNSAGHADSPWVSVQTRQTSPRGLSPPTISHIEGNPYKLLVSWTPPADTNGVLLTYRIQRDNVSFHFSFDTSVLSYTDEDLMPYTTYSYAIIACTIEGCITSDPTNTRTLEAPPALVEAPSVEDLTAYSATIFWNAPLIQNGEITLYILQINGEEIYQGKKLKTQASGLEPHRSYELRLKACTNGGCTTSKPTAIQTMEAPPTGLHAPGVKVTGSESVEVSWREPDHPNGLITSYELRRDGQLVYVGMDTRYHDFTLLPSMEYSYTVTANNSQGTTTSPQAVAKTHPSAPSGVAPPKLQTTGPSSILVEWDPPARANGVIISYSVYRRDPAEPNIKRHIFPPHHSSFQSCSVALTGLKPYYRYEVRVEACTLLGCAASDWASIQTLEAPPSGQNAPLLDLQTETNGIQTLFLLSWSPPAQANGKLLHYELYRRQVLENVAPSGAILVHRNISTSYHDAKLLPFTTYEYQVWAVNSAGRSGSPWARGRTGPAPPEGVRPPTFLRIHATSAVVDISPPAKPNGIVSLYRVFAESKDTHQLLSEGTSRQQTLHGLRPFTLYSVGVEACTCFLCCSRGPVSELRTQASAPAQQAPPRPVSFTSRSALVEWDEPLYPNGIIESCELHVRTACPQPQQPVPLPCSPGSIETRFIGKGQSFNISGLQPYTSYDLRVVSYNNMGSASSHWTPVTTLKEAPQYKEPFLVISNLTTVFLDWGDSFALNGPLRDFVLTESGLRLYSGFHSSLYIPRTSDKTFSFQVTCNTDSGSVSSPVIKYNTATGIGPVEPTDGDKTSLHASGLRFYSELWFIILMSFLGLLLLALLLGLVLRRALNKPPFVRERPPLVPLQKRTQLPASVFSPQGLVDTKISSCSRSAIHSYPSATMSVLRVPSQGTLSHGFSQNSLHRSVSQLIDTHDKKSLMDDGGWDAAVQRTDSGMFVGDEEFVESIKGYSSVRKEHTVFTDTHL